MEFIIVLQKKYSPMGPVGENFIIIFFLINFVNIIYIFILNGTYSIHKYNKIVGGNTDSHLRGPGGGYKK